MTAIQHPALQHHALQHRAARSISRAVDATVGAVVAMLVTALPASWALMVLIDLAGGSVSYQAALPVGLFVGLVPLSVCTGLSRAQTPEPVRAGPARAVSPRSSVTCPTAVTRPA